MKIKSIITGCICFLSFASSNAVELSIGDSIHRPDFSGTLRVRYELSPSDGKGCFQVKNAIAGVSGRILPTLSYKLEADFENAGKVKMRDAYARFTPSSGIGFASLGYMRVPFGYDAMRSPHLQYFANRSFVAKYGGNARDAGLSIQYNIPVRFPLTARCGIFSGSGSRDAKEDRTTAYTYNAGLFAVIGNRFGLSCSFMRTRPDLSSVLHYGAGANYHDRLWHLETEYVHKHYTHPIAYTGGAITDANTFDAFAVRNFTLHKSGTLKSVSALARYDYISRNSEARTSSQVTGSKQRLTVGGTLRLGLTKSIYAETRLNYEKYLVAAGDCDMVVLELMCRF